MIGRAARELGDRRRRLRRRSRSAACAARRERGRRALRHRHRHRGRKDGGRGGDRPHGGGGRRAGSRCSSPRSAASTRAASPTTRCFAAPPAQRRADDEIAPYRYGPPVSPHLGAELAGEPIDPGGLREGARAAAAGADLLVVEGVGGFLVPLTLGADYLVRDLARDLGLPMVVAAAPGLGTINHTLLTIEAVRATGLEAAAVVLTPWPAEPAEVERSNRTTIARLGGVSVETLPRLELSEPASWPSLELRASDRQRARR